MDKKLGDKKVMKVMCIKSAINRDDELKETIVTRCKFDFKTLGFDFEKEVALAASNVDTPNEDGTTPVWAASYHGHTETVKLLAQLGANVDTRNEDGATPARASCK